MAPRAVVLLTHGTLAHRGMEIVSGLQSMLAERGLSSLAINLGLGIDDRPAAMYDCPKAHTHKHADAVNEITTWVGQLEDRGIQWIALLGHPRGGNQAARNAAGQPDPVVSNLVLVAPQTWDEDYAAKDYAQRFGTSLQPVLVQAQALVCSSKGGEPMGPMGFIYCEDTRASADAVVSYYAPDLDMDAPHLLPRIGIPVTVFAGTEDKVVTGLIEKTELLPDGEKIELIVMEGVDYFFPELYSGDIAGAIAERVGE